MSHSSRKHPEFNRSVLSYGNGMIVRQYINWPDDKPLPIGMPHSLRTELQDARKCVLRYFWSFTDRPFRAPGVANIPLGNPMLYVPEVEVAPQKGTLVFPQHGYANKKREDLEHHVKFERYCQDLLDLPKKYHPITVCLHPCDHVWPGEVCEKFGIRTISNGRRVQDPDFSFTFSNNLRAYEYITSSSIGQHIFLATYYKKPAFLYGDLGKLKYDWLTQFIAPFQMGQDEETKYQIVTDFLGVKFKRTPEELERILNRLAEDHTYQTLLQLYDRFGDDLIDLLVQVPDLKKHPQKPAITFKEWQQMMTA